MTWGLQLIWVLIIPWLTGPAAAGECLSFLTLSLPIHSRGQIGVIFWLVVSHLAQCLNTLIGKQRVGNSGGEAVGDALGLDLGVHEQRVLRLLQVQVPGVTQCPRTLDTFLEVVALRVPQRGIHRGKKERKWKENFRSAEL